jgi:hypothetical protein
MEKLFYTLLILSLIGVGVFLIYHEASALPIACWQANDFCTTQCNGSFSLGECWEYNGQIYCFFSCSGFQYPSCGWEDPTSGICDGPIRK